MMFPKFQIDQLVCFLSEMALYEIFQVAGVNFGQLC